MRAIESLFFELLRVATGRCNSLSRNPSEKEWKAMFALAEKQAVAGIAFTALEELAKQGQKPPTALLFEWIGLSEQIRNRNLIVNQRCKELEKLFVDNGFRCCVLKGQGTATLYDVGWKREEGRSKLSEYRQSGDIDLWVAKDGECKTDDVRSEVLQFANSHGYHIGHVDIKHSDIAFFEDVPVEVHFIPSWMFCPLRNRTLQKFFAKESGRQFCNTDAEAGFTHSTIEFDLVFSLVHIYRHVFTEGIGLRQLLDYYYILQHSSAEQRKEAFEVLKSLGMSSFVGGVMYVLQKCFLLKTELLLCETNERHGKFLLSEILIAGNFGHYDFRYTFYSKESRFLNGVVTLKRNFRYLFYYPSEVCWAPFWKLWHWCWRKRKGYL